MMKCSNALPILRQLLMAMFIGLFALANPVHSQEDTVVPMDTEHYSVDMLEKLVAPIALYPDDLLGAILPASTYPLQIVQASRFLEALETDPELQPDEDWNDSIIALLNYPEVVNYLDQEIDWTWKLGEAVINQQADVMNAVQQFRANAYAAGNLKSDQYQLVVKSGDVIEIKPANPQAIYIPRYEPERVVVRHIYPVYHYYPVAYPVYYYPYPASYSFSTGFFWGISTFFAIGWHDHHVHVHYHNHHKHPYYGHRYHYTRYHHPRRYKGKHGYVIANVWKRSNHRHHNGKNHAWRPRHGAGARPSVRSRFQNDHTVSSRHSQRDRYQQKILRHATTKYQDQRTTKRIFQGTESTKKQPYMPLQRHHSYRGANTTRHSQLRSSNGTMKIRHIPLRLRNKVTTNKERTHRSTITKPRRNQNNEHRKQKQALLSIPRHSVLRSSQHAPKRSTGHQNSNSRSQSGRWSSLSNRKFTKRSFAGNRKGKMGRWN